MARYKQLAEKFIRDIGEGKLPEGHKLPSLRSMAKQHVVSMSTAVNCYQELEAAGWIISRPKAGFFVADTPATTELPEWRQFESSVTEPILNVYGPLTHAGPLGVSSTTMDKKAKMAMEQCFKRATKRLNDCLAQYPDPQGELQLRNALSQHFHLQGFPFSSSQVVVTGGCMPAVKAAIETCTKTGDAVAISSPCFNGLLALLKHMGRKIVEIPSTEQGIDLDQFEHHLKQGNVKAGLFCTTHMNPQGITMSVEQKKRLAGLAATYKTPVIEDDVYIELSHSNASPLPAKFYDEEGYILWCGSVSKTLSPSYRLGWCLPGRYLTAYTALFASGSFGVSTHMQLAIADFIQSGVYQSYLKRKRIELLKNKRDYMSLLRAHLPEVTRISNPKGGLVMWIQIPGVDIDALSKEVITAGIDIRLGTLFSGLGLYSDCFRINIGHAVDSEVESEIEKIKRVLLADIKR
ncbi:transcriptional regulator [Veronia nyctiphanis]|uniref:Transcriptional regulator n=1 Tax=Veronia nyctiphanis TaxID=1278244 RepID=A0A4Q0YYX4_9GAMM|nr:PLP-dependent aminotransferase family protein [Veronia nyctiphanis]RXJ74429.1 transcriptional regulator [Veronia nyctiphanis]